MRMDDDNEKGRVNHFTGGRQAPEEHKPELDVGEMEGISFKVEPLRRSDEDPATMKARLLCESFLFSFTSQYNYSFDI